MREGKFHKRERWLWFPAEGGTDARRAKTTGTLYMAYTKQRASIQPLLDERNGEREEEGRDKGRFKPKRTYSKRGSWRTGPSVKTSWKRRG